MQRGIGNLPTRLVLKKLCTLHRPDFLFIAEPWIHLDQLPSNFSCQMNLKSLTDNNRGQLLPNLWGLCNVNISPTVISCSDQQISLSVIWEGRNSFLATVYALTSYLIRRSLWSKLENLQNATSGPWCYIGDFNAILGSHEMRGSSLPLKVSCEEFKDWSDKC